MREYGRILIVDDEFIMRQGMKHMLDWEQEGFQVVGEASNGQEAMKLIEDTRPHIILADIVMPVMDGMEFCELVSRRYPLIQMIILSGYDKFEYVKNTLVSGAVDYILKPTLNPEILREALAKAVSRIPGLELRRGEGGTDYGRMAERFLTGYDNRLDAAAFASFFPHSSFRLLGADIRQIYGTGRETLQKVKRRIREFAASQDKDFVLLPLELEEKTLVCILNYRVSRESRVVEEISRLAQELSGYQTGTFFVLGPLFTAMDKMRDQYRQVILPLTENRFYYEGVTLLAVDPNRETPSPPERFDFGEYSLLLSGRKFEEALTLMETYILAALAARTDVYKLKNLTKNLLYNLLITLEDCHVEAEPVRREFFVRIDEALYSQGFQQILEEAAERIRRLIHTRFGSADQVMREITGYIARNYAQPLELKEVAERFSFNYTYLSTYFNTHNAEGFSGYLNKIRIEQACGMLKKSGDSISDISAAVGYTDHSYFCRVFKKLTGNTPSAYRKKYCSEMGGGG